MKALSLDCVLFLYIRFLRMCQFHKIGFFTGWMFEQRTTSGKPSLSTRMWAIGVKVLSGTTKPLLYSYQGSLPRLPLPRVHDTMQRVIFQTFLWIIHLVTHCDLGVTFEVKFLGWFFVIFQKNCKRMCDLG